MKKILLIICLIFFGLNYSFANTDTDFGPYMRELQYRIKLNWNPPRGNDSQTVVTLFSIDKNGNIFNEKILISSGNQECDNEAIQALRKTSPLRPLPADFEGEKVDVQFTFDYKVFGSSILDENNDYESRNEISSPIPTNKNYNKILSDFSLVKLFEKYKLNYETIRNIAFLLILLIIGCIFVPTSNRK